MNRMDEAITGKLQHLQQRCVFLRGWQGVGPERFRVDEMLHLSVERALQEAIEACLDIGRRLLVRAGRPVPDTNREVFSALSTLGVVPEERVGRWADMAGFRNVLVHQYDRVDLDIVHRVLTGRVGDLEAFGRAVLQHLEGHG